MPVDLSGGRHVSHAPRPASLWKCVSCGRETATPLEQGCPHCGAGKPGEHVGVPEPVRTQSTEVRKSTASADEAFLIWRKGQDVKDYPSTELHAAFLAGWQAALASVVQPELQLAGTAESRTVIAALRLWIDNALPNLAEEIQHGEYLGREDIEALIQKLERANG